MIFGKTNELETLATREAGLYEQKQGLMTLLKAAEKAVGEASADGDAEKEIAAVVTLKAKVSAIDLGIASLRGRRPAAIMARFAEQASTIRAEVAEKQKQLAGIQSKTGRLLAELSRIEAVNYSDDVLSMQSSGPGMYLAPKSDILRSEIQAASAKATALEGQAVPDYGFIDLEEVTDNQKVVTAVLQHPSLAPTAEAIGRWLAACAQSNRVPGGDFGNLARRVRVVWRNGEIDLRESYVFVLGLAKKQSGVMMSNGAVNPGQSTSFDIKSGEFRALAA